MSLKAVNKKQKFNPEPVGGGNYLSQAEIMELIPHRPPMLLVDEVVKCESDKEAIGIKNLQEGDHFFKGHFPGTPIMPGVMIIEAMAQTAAVLVVRSLGEAAKRNLVYFMSIDQARFRRPVVPGNKLELHVKKKKNRGSVWKFTGQAIVDGVVVASATFSAMLRDEKSAG